MFLLRLWLSHRTLSTLAVNVFVIYASFAVPIRVCGPLDLANTRARMLPERGTLECPLLVGDDSRLERTVLQPAFYRTRNFASSSRRHAYFIHQTWTLVPWSAWERKPPFYFISNEIKFTKHRADQSFRRVKASWFDSFFFFFLYRSRRFFLFLFPATFSSIDDESTKRGGLDEAKILWHVSQWNRCAG